MFLVRQSNESGIFTLGRAGHTGAADTRASALE